MINFDILNVDWTTIAAPLVLVVWATALLLLDLFISDKRVTGYIALAGLIASAGVAIPLWNVAPRSGFANMAIHDTTAVAFDLILLLVTAVSILLAMDYLRRQD